LKRGIIGCEKSKFTPITEASARFLIEVLLKPGDVLVSGGCHLGGIDIWAEERANTIGISKIIHYPERLQWNGGFKERNLKIAKDSDIVYCITLKEYPSTYTGRRFSYCYHCNTSDHVKSGGCWTANRAKEAQWYIINPDGQIVTGKRVKRTPI